MRSPSGAARGGAGGGSGGVAKDSKGLLEVGLGDELLRTARGAGGRSGEELLRTARGAGGRPGGGVAADSKGRWR